MIDATTLFNSMDVYSPWFPRKADMLRVTAECVALQGEATVTIQLYTKKYSDSGDGELVDENVEIELDAPGRVTEEWKTVVAQQGVEQLLRFRYTVSGSEDDEWVLFRLLPATWFDALDAS